GLILPHPGWTSRRVFRGPPCGPPVALFRPRGGPHVAFRPLSGGPRVAFFGPYRFSYDCKYCCFNRLRPEIRLAAAAPKICYKGSMKAKGGGLLFDERDRGGTNPRGEVPEAIREAAVSAKLGDVKPGTDGTKPGQATGSWHFRGT